MVWTHISASFYLSNVLLEALVLLEDGLELGLLLQPLLTSAMSFWRPSFSLRMAFSLASCSSLFFSSSSSLSRGSWPGWPRIKTTYRYITKDDL